MGNTANNNWPYPESTDLVKDGATAIENLADAIDTTLGVFVPSNPGLTLINTTSFSGVASQSISSVFTSAYTNYKIVGFVNASGFDELRLRFRTGSTDDTSTTYNWQRFSASGSASGAARVTNSNRGFLNYMDADGAAVDISVFQPQATARTITIDHSNFFTSTAVEVGMASTIFANTTSFDGITFFPENALTTISGTLRVYGWNI